MFLMIAAIIQKELHTTRPHTHHSPISFCCDLYHLDEEEPTQIHTLSAWFFELIRSCFQLTSYPDKRPSQKPDAKNCTKATSITGLSVTASSSAWGFQVSPPWSLPQEPSPVGHRTRSVATSGSLLPGQQDTVIWA